MTPSTETFVTVVSFMVAAPSSPGWSLVRRSTRSQRLCFGSRLDSFFGEDGVDLADALAQSLIEACGQDLLHGLGAGEHALDRHARAPSGDLLDADPDRGDRHVRVGRAVRVGKAVAEDREDVPVAVEFVARGRGHVVLDPTAGHTDPLGDTGGSPRRTSLSRPRAGAIWRRSSMSAQRSSGGSSHPTSG